MNKYIINILLIISIAAILLSCGDCNLITADYPCRIRGATIERFDPRLILQDDSTFSPVPTYSIQTFLFPNDNSSSGILTNDTRFDQTDYLNQYLIVEERSFEVGLNNDLKARLISIHPPNKLMVGDIMLVDVDMNASPPEARLRLYGSVNRFPDDFLSEDAFRFCEEYLTDYRADDEDYNNLSSGASEFGTGLGNTSPESYDDNDIIVIDSKGRDVTNLYRNDIPADIKDEMLNSTDARAVDLIVSAGQVYYYKARNGKEFAVIIADISIGSFEPFIKRITIKFSEIRGQKDVVCPD